ncbi:MAG: hypothetical protein JOZ47_21290 [Kutzneria sp.]|nr:hypothetical protein [Kutzneria sp.]MBV9847582.1 hypothetical protein [Kutzneria sp.]
MRRTRGDAFLAAEREAHRWEPEAMSGLADGRSLRLLWLVLAACMAVLGVCAFVTVVFFAAHA